MRLQNRVTERIELEGNATIGRLKNAVADTFSLAPGTFELSLNGRDALEGSDDTPLSTFDIVSGDLIRVLSQIPEEQPPPPPRGGSSASTSHGSGIKPSSFNSPSTSSQHPTNTSSHNKPSTSRQQTPPNLNQENPSNKDENRLVRDDNAAAPRLSEPMLCREATDKTIPLRLRQLLNRWVPPNQCQTLCIALHVLMLETGFVAVMQQQKTGKAPKKPRSDEDDTSSEYDIASDDTSAMPTDWRDSQSSYKITYTHAMCETAECSVVWVPLGSVLMIHAMSSGQSHFQLQLSASAFIIKSSDTSSPDSVPYKHLSLLSRKYKDEIAHPLLEAMRADLGLAPLHGLMALVPEIQLLILSFLDVRSLLRVSEVCSHFNSVATDMTLWRQLVIRNYGGRISDANTNWKELYKQKYQVRREMEQARSRMTYIFPPLAPPHRGMVPPLPDPLHPMYPPGYRGGDYDLDPFGGAPPPGFGRPGNRGLPNAGPFPGARHDPIFPHSNSRPGRGGGLRDLMGGRNARGGQRPFPPGGGGFGF